MEKANKKGAGRKSKPKNYIATHLFASKLKALFAESGETQEQAANRFNVTRQCFGNWLNGRTQPEYDALCKIAEYYNVSTDYLLGRTDAKTPDTSISGCTQLTGLSEAAVNTIISNHDLCGKLSELLEDNKTWAFIKALEIADNMKQ